MINFLIKGTAFATTASVASFATVLFNIDPSSSGMVGGIIFYLNLFLSLIGVAFLGIFKIKKKINQDIKADEVVPNIFRQSFLLSSFFVGLLFLRQSNILNIISGVFMVVVISATEVYFSKMRKQ